MLVLPLLLCRVKDTSDVERATPIGLPAQAGVVNVVPVVLVLFVQLLLYLPPEFPALYVRVGVVIGDPRGLLFARLACSDITGELL